MHLQPDELFLGVSPPILIDCARQLRERDDGFNMEEFCEALGAPPREAEPVLQRLVEAGFVEVNQTGASFQPTQKLNQLALASLSNGLSRAQATQLLERIIFKAAEINAHPDRYPRGVVCLVVFGSYLDATKELLGDLDVGVELSGPRVETLDPRKGVRAAIAEDLSCSNKSLAALRLGKPKHVSVHMFSEVLELRTPYRVVYGTKPNRAPRAR